MKSFSLALAAVCALMISVVASGNAEDKVETVKCPVAGKEMKISAAKTVSYNKATGCGIRR